MLLPFPNFLLFLINPHLSILYGQLTIFFLDFSIALVLSTSSLVSLPFNEYSKNKLIKAIKNPHKYKMLSLDNLKPSRRFYLIS